MKNLVDTRKEGSLIFYRIRDPQVNELLDVARRIFDTHVGQLRSMGNEDASASSVSSGPGSRRA
jgi:DNA-binding transcriptional ArsR family regulator